MAKIQIIIGTVMGNAFEVAQTVHQELSKENHTVTLNPAFSAGDLSDDNDEIILVCTSNTGMGDLPENILPFFVHLTNDVPNIVGRRYGIINLGDSSYPSFAEAGKTIDNALSDLGAQRIGEQLILDAILVDDYHQETIDWLNNWKTLI